MALFPCPECAKSISEKAAACPHCGLALAGTCPECHQFRTPNAEFCENCGFPFSKIKTLKEGVNNLKAGVNSLAEGAKSIDLSNYGVGSIWFKFWVYVRAPLGALIYLVIGLGFPDFILIGLVGAIFFVAVAVGLHRRSYWAWQANWVLIFEPVVTMGLLPLIVGASSEEQYVGFFSAIILLIVWVLPNWIYFQKRKSWFVETTTTVEVEEREGGDARHCDGEEPDTIERVSSSNLEEKQNALFRKFMIVCWVVFAAAVVVAAGAAAYIVPSKNTVQEFVDTYGGKSIYDAEELNNAGIAFGRRVVSELDETIRRFENQPKTDEITKRNTETRRTNTQNRLMQMVSDKYRYEEARKTWDTADSIGYPAATLAVMMLLWNILWHIGHWIWMGRERT